MSNMSYCRFRNTLGDLRDCVEAFRNYLEPENFPLLREELDAAIELVFAARGLIEMVSVDVDFPPNFENVVEMNVKAKNDEAADLERAMRGE